MIYLSGHGANGHRFGLGRMLAPTRGNTPSHGEIWAADNGCFATPEQYSDAWYLAWLEKLAPWQATCVFATAPDVLCDAAATLAKSAPMFGRLHDLGYPPALVAQNGLEDLTVPWDDFVCLFLGGSTEWKLSDAAASLVSAAKDRGKWVHMGRVNSRRRLMYAKSIGCDSADGNYVAFAPDKNGAQMRKWVEGARMQSSLWHSETMP